LRQSFAKGPLSGLLAGKSLLQVLPFAVTTALCCLLSYQFLQDMVQIWDNLGSNMGNIRLDGMLYSVGQKQDNIEANMEVVMPRKTTGQCSLL
jgi:hypothetical protein